MQNHNHKKRLSTRLLFLLISAGAICLTVLVPMAEIWIVNLFIETPLEYDFGSCLVFAIANAIVLFIYFLLASSRISPEDKIKK